ncbi:MAG: cell division protein FtsZ [Clostridiales bacterium]|nr:cell division protein FtsZ [Clostridiales bacterium]
MPFKSVEEQENIVNIKVIGVGGGGNNAVNRMIKDNVQGVEFIAINTDQQALNHSEATHKILIGETVTHGRGAGSDPETGKKAAEENKAEIEEALRDTEMVFISAGMGGGTGTGAAPMIARIAKDMGILTVGIVTKPFAFEGTRKMQQAENGIRELLENVDSLVVIPNEKLNQISDQKITLANAFQLADSVLKQGVQSITELIKSHGFINLDFADVRRVMADAGYAHMCVASAAGKDKVDIVAHSVISSPLLETSLSNATGIVLNFTADPEVALEDIYRAADIIRTEASDDAEIIWGVALDDSLNDELKLTVIATGFDIPESSEGAFYTPPLDVTYEEPDKGTRYVEEQHNEERSNQKREEKQNSGSLYDRLGNKYKVFQNDNSNSNKNKQSSSSTTKSEYPGDDEDQEFWNLLNEITKTKGN